MASNPFAQMANVLGGNIGDQLARQQQQRNALYDDLPLRLGAVDSSCGNVTTYTLDTTDWNKGVIAARYDLDRDAVTFLQRSNLDWLDKRVSEMRVKL